MYPPKFLLSPWYFLYDFKNSYFPEQHPVSTADDQWIVIKTRNFWNVTHEFVSMLRLVNTCPQVQSFVVGLVSFMLRFSKYLFNACDMYLTFKGLLLIKAGKY